MQTRRKSLNLGDLGVIAPKRSRTASHPSPPATIVETDERPIKKSKRSHASDSRSPTPMSPPRMTNVIRLKEERPTKPSAAALSPPPSPVAEGGSKSQIDTEGIHDDIVVGVIRQLEKTGNRPHLVKELAAILATDLHIVEKSANPCALISSRLTAYLNRAWPAISPCPLAKDLSPVHPRRLYFHLTTSPRQPIPDTIEPPPKANRIISPSLSSASAADEDDGFTRDRHALSPSPEIDLSSPELDPDPVEPPGTTFPTASSASRSRDRSHYSRRASPPLELEERDFKQTASALHEQAQQHRNSLSAAASRRPSDRSASLASSSLSSFSSRSPSADVNMDGSVADGGDASYDDAVPSVEAEERKNSEAAVALFGGAAAETFGKTHRNAGGLLIEFSSPLLQPQTMIMSVVDDAEADVSMDEEGKSAAASPLLPSGMEVDGAGHGATPDHTAGATSRPSSAGGSGGRGDYRALEAAFELDDTLLSPEKVELAELEDMFDAY